MGSIDVLLKINMETNEITSKSINNGPNLHHSQCVVGDSLFILKDFLWELRLEDHHVLYIKLPFFAETSSYQKMIYSNKSKSIICFGGYY